jgi:hypothetical protein
MKSSDKIIILLLTSLLATLSAIAQNPVPSGFQPISASWKGSPITTDCAGFTDAFDRTWTDPLFGDSTWSGLTPPDAGSFNTPGLNPSDRFYRGQFSLTSTAQPVFLFFVSDDGIEIFVNGKPLTPQSSFSPQSANVCHQLGCVNILGCGPGFDLDPGAVQIPADLLVSGSNLIAAHVSNGGGGSYFDMAVLASSTPESTVNFVSDTTWDVFTAFPQAGSAPVGKAVDLCGVFWSCGGFPATIPEATPIWAPVAISDLSDLAQFYFAKTITIPGAPLGGTVSVAADDLAEVFINGISAGPPHGSLINPALSGLTQAQTYDASTFLHQGDNQVVIRGQNGPNFFGGCSGPCTYAQNPASVIFKGSFLSSPPPPPAITSISHDFGTQGQTITNFTVNGHDFQSTSTLSFSGSGILVNSYSLRTSSLIVASITVFNNASIGSQDLTVTNSDTQQSAPGGPFTILQAPSGQLVLTFENAPTTRALLLTPALQTTSCINSSGKSNPIRGNTGEVKLLAKVRTVQGKPAAGVPVTFRIVGPNAAASSTVLTDKAGRAILVYSGVPKIYSVDAKDQDTITASAPVGDGNSTIVSDIAHVEWGQVTVAFKMPLPSSSSPHWLVSTRVNDPTDINHQCNGYYSLDLVDDAPASEPPILVPLDGTATTVNLDPNASTFGIFSMIDQGNNFQTISAHLANATVQIGLGPVFVGQVIAAMGNTGLVQGPTGIHLHFQVRYSGTSGRNDNLRIFIEQEKIEDYCVNGQLDNDNNVCTAVGYSSSNNGLPFGVLESPVANSTVNSAIGVSGWALDDESINAVKILIDGSLVATATYGIPRPEVCNQSGSLFTWSGFLSCPNVGFSAQLDTTVLTNGSHQLTISAVDNNGAERIIGTVPIVVSNLVFPD